MAGRKKNNFGGIKFGAFLQRPPNPPKFLPLRYFCHSKGNDSLHREAAIRDETKNDVEERVKRLEGRDDKRNSNSTLYTDINVVTKIKNCHCDLPFEEIQSFHLQPNANQM